MKKKLMSGSSAGSCSFEETTVGWYCSFSSGRMFREPWTPAGAERLPMPLCTLRFERTAALREDTMRRYGPQHIVQTPVGRKMHTADLRWNGGVCSRSGKPAPSFDRTGSLSR